METFFKKYFWTVDLAVIAVAAWLMASTTNTVLGHKLQLLPSVASVGSAPAAAPAKAKDKTLASRARDNFMFGKPAATPQPDPSALAAAEAAEAEALAAAEEEEKKSWTGECPTALEEIAQLEKSGLGGELVATVVARNLEDSIAVVAFKDQGTRVLSVGEGGEFEEDPFILEYVLRKVAVINREGTCERLDLDEEAKPKVSKKPKRSSLKSKKDDDDDKKSGGGVVKRSDTEYDIAQDEINNVLSNLSKVATQARIVPNFKNGKADGFKLFSIRPNSIYAKIGIRNGDIVKKVNDFTIDSPDKALELYQKLKDAQHIKVQLERRGQTKTMNYNIR